MTIREFVKTVWDGRLLVVVSMLVVLAGAWVYVDRQATVYGSSAVVRVGSAAAGVAGEPTAQIAVTTEDALATPVLEEAAAELGTSAAAVKSEVSAAAGAEDGSVFVISSRTADEAAAQEVAAAVADAFAAHIGTLRDEQVDALEAQRDAYREANSGVEDRLRANPGDVLAVADQEAIVSRYSEIGDQMLALRAITVPGEVIQAASDPLVQGFPLRTVLPVAGLAGLFAGLALALLKRGFDSRLRSAAEAVRLTDLPVLAVLSDVREADRDYRRDGVLPVSSRSATPFTESIRELRTAVQVSAGADPHVIVITASDARPPRSFIAANLAASLALSGLRTVIVSGDLRRSELLDLVPPPAGWAGDDRGLRPSRVPNLDVLRIADDRMDPADYLATTQVRETIEGLRSHADVVVVDAPPVLVAADATILGGYGDGVVLVSAVGATQRTVLADAAGRLRTNDVPVIGVALAGVEGDRGRRYAASVDTHERATGLRRLFGRGHEGRQAPASVRSAQTVARLSAPSGAHAAAMAPVQPGPAAHAAQPAPHPAQPAPHAAQPAPHAAQPGPAAHAAQPAPHAAQPAPAAAPQPVPPLTSPGPVSRVGEPEPEPRPMPVAIPPVSIPPWRPRTDAPRAGDAVPVAGRPADAATGADAAAQREPLAVRTHLMDQHDTDRVPLGERGE